MKAFLIDFWSANLTYIKFLVIFNKNMEINKNNDLFKDKERAKIIMNKCNYPTICNKNNKQIKNLCINRKSHDCKGFIIVDEYGNIINNPFHSRSCYLALKRKSENCKLLNDSKNNDFIFGSNLTNIEIHHQTDSTNIKNDVILNNDVSNDSLREIHFDKKKDSKKLINSISRRNYSCDHKNSDKQTKFDNHVISDNKHKGNRTFTSRRKGG